MRSLVSIALFGLAIGMVQAAPITGSLWVVPDAVAQNAIPANIPGTAPDVTFDVNAPLNFNNGGSINAFLSSGGAFNISGPSGILSQPISPSLIQFTGMVSVTNGQQFTVTHDDGLTLIIGGLPVISVPGATPPVTTIQTYTGPSGDFPFTLVYGECCGGAAVLQIDLPFSPGPSGIPEPGTFGLAAAGLVLAIARFRLRR